MKKYNLIIALISLLTALNACSGGSRPDPLHSLGKKKILRRSVSLLPEWVAGQRDIWIRKETITIKVYNQGESFLSNALAVCRQKIPELARNTLRDYLRDTWLLSPLSEKISNVRINTALYLNRIFLPVMDSVLSNTLSSSTNYWELWQMETRDETKRAFTIYHKLEGKTSVLDDMIRRKAAAVEMKKWIVLPRT